MPSEASGIHNNLLGTRNHILENDSSGSESGHLNNVALVIEFSRTLRHCHLTLWNSKANASVHAVNSRMKGIGEGKASRKATCLDTDASCGWKLNLMDLTTSDSAGRLDNKTPRFSHCAFVFTSRFVTVPEKNVISISFYSEL